MRIIVKPLGFVALAAVAVVGMAVPRFLMPAKLVLRDADWIFSKSDDILASSQVIDDPEARTVVRRFAADRVALHPWSASWTNNLTVTALPAGMPLTVRFRARSRTRSRTTVRLQSSQPPYSTHLEKTFTLTPTWAEYSLSGKSSGYRAGGSQLTFYLSHSIGEVDLDDIRMEPR